MDADLDVAVVGGGVSGLTAAFRLRRLLGDGARIAVFEQSGRLGGKLRTVELAGMPTDVGAEAFVLRNPAAVRLVDELGLADRLVHPELSAATVHAAGRTVSLPRRTFLGVPADADAVAGLLSADGVASVAAERTLPPLRISTDPEADDLAVGAVLAERFGAELVDRLVDPLLGGVYATRAASLGLRATMPALVAGLEPAGGSLTAAARELLGAAQPESVQAESARPVFGALRGGLGVLIDTLAARSAADVVLGAPVTALQAEERTGGWRLAVGSPSRSPDFRADAVVLAVPPPATRKLLDGSPLAPLFAAMAVTSTAVLSMALPAGVELPNSSGVLVAAGERHRDRTPFTAKAFTYTSRKWGRPAGGPVLLRASIDSRGGPEVLRRPDERLLAEVRADLAELAGVTAPPLDWTVTRWGGGLTQYGPGHTGLAARIERAVRALPGLAVAGAALHGVGIPACVNTATAAAERVAAHLQGMDEFGRLATWRG